MENSSVFLQQLTIVSPARKYNATFKKGLNIISGPIFTGKSSILKLIDYCFGAKSPPDFPELSHCTSVFLECQASGELITLSRSLKNISQDVDLFYSSITEVLNENLTGEKLCYKTTAGKESVNSFLLKKLGLWDSLIRISPTQSNSNTQAFSFRDLIKTIYIDQNRISSETAFFENDPIKNIKLVQTLEIMLGLSDDRKAILGSQLKQTEEEIKTLSSELEITKKFLNQSKIPKIAALEEQIENCDAEKTKIRTEISNLRDGTKLALGENIKLVEKRNEIASEISHAKARSNEANRSLKNLSRLRVQYDREHKQLEFLKESNNVLGLVPVSICPSCFQKIELKNNHGECGLCCRKLPDTDGNIYVDSRLKSLKRRIRDLEKFVEDIENELNFIENEVESKNIELGKVDKDIKRISESYVLPETKEAVALEVRLASIDEKIVKLHEWKSYRLRAQGEGSRLPALRDKADEIKEQIEALPYESDTRENILTDIQNRFKNILKSLSFPEHQTATLTEKFIPELRGQTYSKLSSAGAISLVVSSFFLSILDRSMEKATNYPDLLMIDSPLNQLGRDQKDKDFKDQIMVDAFYAYLDSFSKKHSEFQIILVDNRVPDGRRDLVTIEFTRNPNKGRFGLIDDQTENLDPKEISSENEDIDESPTNDDASQDPNSDDNEPR